MEASATTPPARRLSRPARRAQLLEVAEQVFAEVGAAHATFDLIAARAGVTRPLLYTYFASVGELYVECHRTARDELTARLLAAAGTAQGPEARLREGLRAYLRYLHERPARWELLYGTGAPTGEHAAEAARMRFATAEQLSALFVAAAPSVDPDVASGSAHAVSGAAEQLARWWQRRPDVPLDHVLDVLMATLWTGLHRMLAPEDAAAG